MKAENDKKTDSEAVPNSTPVRLDVALAEALGAEAASPPPSPLMLMNAQAFLESVAVVGATNPELARRVGAAFFGSVMSSGLTVLFMTKQEYAEHIAYSVRTLDKLIDAGLPTRGKGRRLRIPVREADAWMLQQEPDQLDEIDLLASRNAKKPRRSGGANG